MDKILIMSQDDPNKLKDILENDVWVSIQEFLNFGLHLGQGDKAIHVTVGLLLAITVAFIVTTVILKWLRRLFTRKMEPDDKLKFISVFKFIRYHGISCGCIDHRKRFRC